MRELTVNELNDVAAAGNTIVCVDVPFSDNYACVAVEGDPSQAVINAMIGCVAGAILSGGPGAVVGALAAYYSTYNYYFYYGSEPYMWYSQLFYS